MTAAQLALNVLFKAAAVFSWHRSPWLAAALFIAPDCYLLTGMFRPASLILGPMFTRFQPSAPEAREVWLTIDDGPDPADTPRLLELLARHDARATFFLIGSRAARHPALVDEILRRGHAVGHHTYSHPAGTFWMATPRRCRREIEAGFAALSRPGVRPTAFRPPVGIRNLGLHSVLAEAGLDCVGWTIRSGDSFSWRAASLVHRVMGRVAPGAIILTHEGPSVPAACRVRLIGDLVAALSQAGYRCVIPPRAALRLSGGSREAGRGSHPPPTPPAQTDSDGPPSCRPQSGR